MNRALPAKTDTGKRGYPSIAIIGGGIARFVTGYFLYDRYQVTLFEQSYRESLSDASCCIIPDLHRSERRSDTYYLYAGSHFGFGLHEDAVLQLLQEAGLASSSFEFREDAEALRARAVQNGSVSGRSTSQ